VSTYRRNWNIAKLPNIPVSDCRTVLVDPATVIVLIDTAHVFDGAAPPR